MPKWNKWLDEEFEEMMLPKKVKITKKSHQIDEKASPKKPTSIKHQQK
jgi:hypothetical protein